MSMSSPFIANAALLTQRAPGPVTLVSAVPGTRNWIAAGRETFGGRGLLFVGSLETGEAKLFEGFEWVTGLLAVDASAVHFTNGSTVVQVRLPELDIAQRTELTPVREAWGAGFAGAGERIALIVTARLCLLGADVKSVDASAGELSERDYFTAVAFLPGATSLVVGRGDGRVELRDVRTLEVTKVLRPLPSTHQRLAQICALDDECLAVSDGNRTTGMLSLATGAFERLDYEDAVIGLHRLADGRLAVIAPRRIIVYAGNARHVDVDFTSALSMVVEHGSFQRSALSGDTLLLACGQGGLLAVEVLLLPLAPPRDEALFRECGELLGALAEALSAKADVNEVVAALLRLDDPKSTEKCFDALSRSGVPLRSAPLHLKSEFPKVRNATVRHMTTFAKHFAAHALDVKPLLQDPVPNIRFQAMYALNSIGDPAAIPWLEPLRNDPNILLDELDRVLSELAAKR